MQNDTHSGFIFTFNHVDIHVISFNEEPYIAVKRIADYVDDQQWLALLHNFNSIFVTMSVQMPGDPKNISVVTACVSLKNLQPILDYLYDEHNMDINTLTIAKKLKAGLVAGIESAWSMYRRFGGGRPKQDQDK